MLVERKLLAAAISLSLAACGGSSSESNDNQPLPTTFTVTAIDGYLANALVSVDTDSDGSCDLDLGNTDANGDYQVAEQYGENLLCVSAIAGQTIDNTRGIVQSDFGLQAPAGSAVITPLTNLVVELMSADSELGLEAAQQAVVSLVNTSGLADASAEQVFGDFLASEGLLSSQLEIISKALVDNAGEDSTVQSQILERVAEIVSQAEDAAALEDLEVVVEVDPENGIIVTENARPVATASIANITAELEQELASIDLSEYFNDADGDELSFSVIGTAASVDGSILSLSTASAGEFAIAAYATDSKGTRSYPLSFTLTVSAANTPPEAVDSAETALNEAAALWQIQTNQQISELLDVSALFTDADQDQLTVTASSNAAGLSAEVSVGQLSLGGSIAQAGSYQITLSATDGVNSDPATAVINFTVTAGASSYVLIGQFVENVGSNSFDQGSGNWSSLSELASTVEQMEIEIDGESCSGTATYRVSSELVDGEPAINSYPLDSFSCEFDSEDKVLTLTSAYDEGDYSGTALLFGVQRGSGLSNSSLSGDYIMASQFVENAGSTVFNQGTELYDSLSEHVSIVEFGLVDFDGAGGCEAEISYIQASELSSSGSSRQPSLSSIETDSFTCPQYTVSSDGSFSLDTASFVLSADGQVIVGRNAYLEAAEDYSGTQHTVMVKKATGLTAADLNGTYKITSHHVEHTGETSYSSETGALQSIAGLVSSADEGTVSFDGQGGCSLSLEYTFSELDSDGNPSIASGSETDNCSYTMGSDGTFSIDTARFAVSEDLSVIIGVNAYSESDYTGTQHSIMVKQ